MEIFQSFLLPIAVFLLVTGLWLRLVFPAEREGRGNGGGDKARAMIASMAPAFGVAVFGGLVWYLTGAAIFATIAFGSGYILAMLLRRSGRRRDAGQRSGGRQGGWQRPDNWEIVRVLCACVYIYIYIYSVA